MKKNVKAFKPMDTSLEKLSFEKTKGYFYHQAR